MQHSLLFTLLFLFLLHSPLLAEELPRLWLEAGKETEVRRALPDESRSATHWTLRFAHRTIASGRIVLEPNSLARLTIKTPSLDAGKTLQGKLFFDDLPVNDVTLAASDPFENRDIWFAKHPISLYDPEGVTSELFEGYGIPFKKLTSFAEIENERATAILLGQQIDFDEQKGLAEILFHKARQGNVVLVFGPEGNVSLESSGPFRSMRLTSDREFLYGNCVETPGKGGWKLRGESKGVFLASEPVESAPTILELRFSSAKSAGRILFDKQPLHGEDEAIPWQHKFKTVVETISNKDDHVDKTVQ